MPEDNKDLIGKQTQSVPVRPKEIGIDTTNNFTDSVLDGIDVGSVNLSQLDGFSNVAQTREEVYSLIDTMSQDDAISSILETYVEDITNTNDDGKIAWCESSDERITKYVNYLLESLNVDKNMYNWAFKLCKYGDLYLRLYRESDYGDDLLFDNKGSALNEDVKLHKSSKNDHYIPYVEAMDNPGEMFELTQFGKSMAYIKASSAVQKNYSKDTSLSAYVAYNMKRSDVDVFDATEFVHACLEDNSSRTPEEVNIFTSDGEDEEGNDVYKKAPDRVYKVKRGQSLLYNSFKIWRELTLLENSVLLNRLTKSAIVRVLNVDVGDMPKDSVNNFMTRLKSNIEQKSALNAGESMSEYTNPGPIENIIYVPTHGTQGTINAQTIGGDVDPKQLTDLDWFNNKLYGSLRVPKAYFGWTDDGAGFNGGTSLSILSSRYGKAVTRIQNTLCQCLTDLINLFLIDRGLTSYVNKFTIKMQHPITQEELDKRENMRNRIGVVSDVMNQVDGVVDDDLTKTRIVKELLSGSSVSPEVISLMQEYIDKKTQEQKNQKPEKTETADLDSEEENEDMDDMPELDEPSENEESIRTSSIEEPANESETEEFSMKEPVETETNAEEQGEESYLPSPDELNLDLTSM